MNKDEIRKMKALPTIRFERKYRGADIYVNVSYFRNQFVEIFVSFALPNKHENEYMEASWDGLTRVLSCSNLPIEKIIKQLGKAGRRSDDQPSIIVSVLRDFSKQMRRMKAHGE